MPPIARRMRAVRNPWHHSNDFCPRSIDLGRRRIAATLSGPASPGASTHMPRQRASAIAPPDHRDQQTLTRRARRQRRFGSAEPIVRQPIAESGAKRISPPPIVHQGPRELVHFHCSPKPDRWLRPHLARMGANEQSGSRGDLLEMRVEVSRFLTLFEWPANSERPSQVNQWLACRVGGRQAQTTACPTDFHPAGCRFSLHFVARRGAG